ncbi:hypothetical protein D041_1839B, partial [Vibrio parahaemolyticus EKP-008]
ASIARRKPPLAPPASRTVVNPCIKYISAILVP